MLKIDGIEIAQRHVEYALKVDPAFGKILFCEDKPEAISLAKEIQGAVVLVQYVLVSFWHNLATGEIVYDDMEEII